MVIVFDGPAGVGKSTIAKTIALELGYAYIDTGAMYRAVTLFALENGVAIDTLNQQALLDLVLNEPFKFVFTGGSLRVYHGNRDITTAVRSQLVSQNVSSVAAMPAVRAGLTDLQRKMAASANVVMEGRDIGTVVLPGADYKFYLTASAEIRAKRRFLELKAQGIEIPLEAIQAEIEARDKLDSSRLHAPLRKAEDAIEIDTSNLDIPEVLARILSYIK